jgi:7-cyano-7-deazaguanine synthase
MNSKRALMIYSGGQDSTTCLFWALKEFKEVWAIGFNYGQRHLNELRAAEIITREAGVPYQVFSMSTLPEVSGNALTNKKMAIDTRISYGEPPNTLVEGRNLLFLTYAGIYAKQMGIPNLVMGVSQTDYSGYPDCRNEFILAANTTLNFAFDVEFKIHTPLMWKSKAETWHIAKDLGVFELIRDKTVTCYYGIAGAGCGKCPACQLRAKGLHEFLNENTVL